MGTEYLKGSIANSSTRVSLYYTSCYFPRTVADWNTLPEELVNISSLKTLFYSAYTCCCFFFFSHEWRARKSYIRSVCTHILRSSTFDSETFVTLFDQKALECSVFVLTLPVPRVRFQINLFAFLWDTTLAVIRWVFLFYYYYCARCTTENVAFIMHCLGLFVGCRKV